MIIDKWSHIMIHHSATADGQTVSWPAIRRYHMFEKGYRDIGYHFGIEFIGNNPPSSPDLTPPSPSYLKRGTEEGALHKGGYEILVGRNLTQEGAHCAGMNDRAIGICFIGNFDEAPPPADQWAAGILFVKSLCQILMIPMTCVIGHRDFAKKTCPGKLFDMDLFRRDLGRTILSF